MPTTRSRCSFRQTVSILLQTTGTLSHSPQVIEPAMPDVAPILTRLHRADDGYVTFHRKHPKNPNVPENLFAIRRNELSIRTAKAWHIPEILA